MQPSTIKIFLVNGSPTGLRTAEISNWSGKAIACPRTELSDLLAREECDHPGVYVLTGIDSDSGESVVYIGEAEQVSKRLKSHKDRDFWNAAVVFLSKDENLTKGHVKYLEGKLITQAADAKKAKVMNSQSSGSHLPESDSAEMDVFCEKIFQLLPIMGVSAFRRVETAVKESSGLYFCKIKGLTAKGKRSESGFVVFAGSEAVADNRPSARWTKELRDRLKEEGVLIEEGDRLVFSRDYEFGSPSTAASAVRGGATNGLLNWKTKEGKTLKEIEKNS